MPKWMRLPSTSSDPLSHRVGSAFENGYGDEGPLAKAIVVGGCVFLPLAFTLAVFGGVAWGVWCLIGLIF